MREHTLAVWIDLQGTIHDCPKDHELWADEYLHRLSGITPVTAPWGEQWGTYNLLLRGWVRITCGAVQRRRSFIRGPQLAALKHYYTSTCSEERVLVELNGTARWWDRWDLHKRRVLR